MSLDEKAITGGLIWTIPVENVKQSIKELKEIEEELLLKIYGIIFAETTTENTVECIKEAFKKYRNKQKEIFGKGLI